MHEAPGGNVSTNTPTAFGGGDAQAAREVAHTANRLSLRISTPGLTKIRAIEYNRSAIFDNSPRRQHQALARGRRKCRTERDPYHVLGCACYGDNRRRRGLVRNRRISGTKRRRQADPDPLRTRWWDGLRDSEPNPLRLAHWTRASVKPTRSRPIKPHFATVDPGRLSRPIQPLRYGSEGRERWTATSGGGSPPSFSARSGWCSAAAVRRCSLQASPMWGSAFSVSHLPSG